MFSSLKWQSDIGFRLSIRQLYKQSAWLAVQTERDIRSNYDYDYDSISVSCCQAVGPVNGDIQMLPAACRTDLCENLPKIGGSTFCGAAVGICCIVVVLRKTFAHFLHSISSRERERGRIAERELVLYYYFVASFLYYRWQVFCYFGHNLWCKKWKRSCSCQLPTTKEVADRAKTFSGARRALWRTASFPHKICLIKIFVKICKLFCSAGSLRCAGLC